MQRADVEPGDGDGTAGQLQAADRRVRGPSPGRRSPRQLERLADQARGVMAPVAAGLSNDEIAEQLVVSPATAKTHVSRPMVKLHARGRAHLVVFASESGLVRAG